MRLHFVAFAAAVAALAGQSANAADLPSRMPTKAPAQVVAYNWSGIYTSSSIGAAWRHVDGTFADTPGSTFNTRGTKAWTGSSIGVQQQWGNVVLGVEASYYTPLSNKFDSSNAGGADCTNTLGVASSCETRLNSIWTVGGKVGYSFGNWMVYGSGGYASGRLQSRINNLATGLLVSDFKETHGGWYAGGGFDVYVTRVFWSDLILGVEYKHIDLNSKLITDPVPTGSRFLDATVDMVMAKATFKWVGAGPFSAFR